ARPTCTGITGPGPASGAAAAAPRGTVAKPGMLAKTPMATSKTALHRQTRQPPCDDDHRHAVIGIHRALAPLTISRVDTCPTPPGMNSLPVQHARSRPPRKGTRPRKLFEAPCASGFSPSRLKSPPQEGGVA